MRKIASVMLVCGLVAAQVHAQGQKKTDDGLPPVQPPPPMDEPAAPATPAALVGNADTGKLITYTCQGCHGVVGYRNVYPTYHVPRIGGQSALYLSNALHEYQKGTRKHPTMQAQAQSFSDQDIADIAAFLSGLKP